MTSEIKALAFCATVAGGILIFFGFNNYIEAKNELKEHADDIAYKLKKAELEASYPPEYWTAKAAEAEADAKVRQAKIESDERLKLDLRAREQAEKEAQRKYEQNAPAEYWQQKRVEQEEQTKRERDRLQYESEQEIAKQHRDAIKQGTRAVERALERQFIYPNTNRYITM